MRSHTKYYTGGAGADGAAAVPVPARGEGLGQLLRPDRAGAHRERGHAEDGQGE